MNIKSLYTPRALFFISFLIIFLSILSLVIKNPFVLQTLASDGRVVTVCSSGCNYTHPNDAIANAQNNDTIFINQAVFDGSAVVSGSPDWQLRLPSSVKNLTIRGRGQNSTQWQLSFFPGGNGNMLHIQALNGVNLNIRDLTFRFNSNTNAPFVNIYPDNVNTWVNFSNVSVMGSNNIGIVYQGTNTKGTIQNSYFEGNRLAALNVRNISNINILNSKFNSNYAEAILANDSSRFMANDCEFTNNGKEITTSGRTVNSAVTLIDSSTASIIFSDFNSNNTGSISISGSANSDRFVWIENNLIINTLRFDAVRIQGNKTVQIARNQITSPSNHVTGLRLNSTGTVYALNNIIDHNTSSGIAVGGTTSTRNYIYNNVIANNSEDGVIYTQSGTTTFRNNIVYDNDRYGIQVVTQGNDRFTGKITSGTNIVYGNGTNYMNYHANQNDINQNPLFRNNSYTLQSNSPGINAGDQNVMLNGTSWSTNLNGTRIDIGAYGGPFPFAWEPDLKLKINNISTSVVSGQQVNIPVLSNAKGVGMKIVDVQTPPAGGAAVNDSRTGIIYQSLSNFTGTVRFNYYVEDTFGNLATATITVQVNTANPSGSSSQPVYSLTAQQLADFANKVRSYEGKLTAETLANFVNQLKR